MAQKTVLEFPGYALTDAKNYYVDGDVIALPYESQRYGTLYSFYTFGSAAGFAMKYGECPERAIAQKRERGNPVHWLNQNATVISNQQAPKRTFPLQMWGDVVRFHGRKFTLVKDRYSNNAFLVECGELV